VFFSVITHLDLVRVRYCAFARGIRCTTCGGTQGKDYSREKIERKGMALGSENTILLSFI
jgi:hypothetical protein